MTRTTIPTTTRTMAADGIRSADGRTDPAGSRRTDPAGGRRTDPAGPAAQDPAGKGAGEPAAVDPAEPAGDDPAGPAAVGPAHPAAVDPAHPAAVDPADPAAVGPAHPAAVGPADPGAEKHGGPRGRQTSRPGLTVRARILIVVLALTGVTLLVAGGSAWVLQRERVDDTIDATLRHAATDFASFAGGVRPETDVRTLLYDGMLRAVPATNQGMLGFVGERLELTLPSGPDLAGDAALVDRLTADLAGLAAGDGGGSARISSAATPTGQYRYALVPVTVGDAVAGGLVIAVDRSAEQAPVDEAFATYAAVSVAAFALLAVVGWVMAGRLLSPVRHLREAAEQISDTDLSRRIPVRGNDDLSQLTRTVNAMLARLEDSFASQRRLLDDAGHELRTPITIVRGHLEVMDPADAGDAAATRELALRELDRMHRLADDLLILAKAEQPHFVQPAPTSLGELLDNVLDQARPLGERRWRVDERVEADAVVDAQRLTQALLQLAANAVTFSAPGSTVAVGSALRGDRLHLWVRDEGVGIPPEEQDRIFGRFVRTSGRARPGEGAGLGLAIVAAIAAGHGGTARVSSVPGAGSTFVLDLPARGVVRPAGSNDDDGGPGPWRLAGGGGRDGDAAGPARGLAG
ncbi:ATP-binding protein [Georgenia sp. TF02-10]|uniref:sensor histidine kinase n=1 Tax=Georgenia sp. TF02-10 TaxID=2917725 RepID=UPI001FA73CF4|nr:HAMP domain-containing sensor histidine kinase [Georgenia sp. TF02-10]UNX54381.1 ATP-binding protein [Georgenia sp. TF02-10]